MKIALIGYGKMGKAIETIALARGHEISVRITSGNLTDFSEVRPGKTDVAIEFTNPGSAPRNILGCLDVGVPVVCGSTGWFSRLGEISAVCTALEGSLVYGSNFSIGVNIFFELNRKLAALLADYPEYRVSVTETHHTAKKDAPSGTAITIAEGILAERPALRAWVDHASGHPDELPVISHRIDPAPGTHEVLYHSAIDDIRIGHVAHNREGFASGAVVAAEFLRSRKGVYTMKDVLGL